MSVLRTIFIASIFAMPLASGTARAASFSSGAAATSVNLSAAGVVKANASVAPVSGTAPPAYDTTGGVASINQAFNLVSSPAVSASEALTSGIVNTEAWSNAPGQTSATGVATLANVGSTLSSQAIADLLPVAAIGLTANMLSSTTTAGVGANGLYSSGASTISGLDLTGTVLGALGFDGSLYSNPAANTVALAVAGLTVTLNEQKRTLSANSIFAQTNAVHIALVNYSLAGKLLNGDIILGHSEAMASVPEPATWATMLAGFGMIGAVMRRRRPAQAFA